MNRGIIVWSVVTAALGGLLCVLATVQLVAENLWLGHQAVALDGMYSSKPLYLVGVIGLVLLVGGLVAASRAARTTSPN